MTTNTWEIWKTYSLSLSLNYNAIFAANDGSLIAHNLLGNILKFPIFTNDPPTFLNQGGSLLSLSGDGARCIDGSVPSCC